MSDTGKPQGQGQPDDFAQQAAAGQPGFAREFLEFLRYNKKWSLTPLFVILLLVGFLIFLSGTAIAPFIYPLF